MKKLIYLFGLIILIGCNNKQQETITIKCQLQHSKGDTIYSKSDSLKMKIFDLIHDFDGTHKNCTYSVLFRLDNQFQTGTIEGKEVY